MKKINEILLSNINPYFNIKINKENYTTSNKESFYSKLDHYNLTFDTSNQKALANIDVFGNIKYITFFQGNFLTEEKPGVWVNKQITQTKDLEIKFIINNKEINLSNKNHSITVDILSDCIIRIIHDYKDFKIYLIPFCPIVDEKRYSMLLYNIYIENTSNKDIECKVIVPDLYKSKYSDTQNILINSKNCNGRLIKPGEYSEAFLSFIDPNTYIEQDDFYINDMNIFLLKTKEYYENIFGILKLDDNHLVHMFRRSLYQSFASFGMNSNDEIVGSNWGSYPATNRIWNKDMFYSSLSFVLLDSDLCKSTILWFEKYSVKFHGTKFKGGVTHSLSNSLACLILSSLYLQYTEDINFFYKNPSIVDNCTKILDTILNTRKENDPYLFESTWISDALSLGKYHTGTNICMWRACKGLGYIYNALGEENLALKYLNIAQNIKSDILKYMTVEGPFGKQFLEGIGDLENRLSIPKSTYEKPIIEQGLIFLSDVIENDKINLLMHDGEESDTTLIPFYNFLDKNNEIYINTMKFSSSANNPTYSEEIKGIKWGLESGATFPGFITVLMSNISDENLFKSGLNELKKLCDLDGSWWWWPYKLNSKYGDVVRDFGCGKCGWASGLFTTLFITQYLGINIKENNICISPIEGLKNFTWLNLKIGNKKFSIIYKEKEIIITNHGNKLENFEIIKTHNNKNIVDNKNLNFKIKKINNIEYLVFKVNSNESINIERI